MDIVGVQDRFGMESGPGVGVRGPPGAQHRGPMLKCISICARN